MNKMRTTVSTLAILGSLGMIQNVSAVPVPGACPDYIDAIADNNGVLERSSAVTSAAEQDTTTGAWVYRYRVCNTTDPYYAGTGNNVIVDWELPWFDDGQITDIITPFGWSWSIETVGVRNPFTGWGTEDTNGDGLFNDDDAVPAWSLDGDPWKDIFDLAYDVAGGGTNPFTNVEKVLHFYTESFQAQTFAAVVEEREECGLIFENESCGGFGFSSPLDAADAPYQASWLSLPVRTGDPLYPLGDNGSGGGIPNSPSVQQRATIPEPATSALIGAGLLSVAALRRRRRKQ